MINDETRYRRDIQCLRGIAVLLVLLHHAKVPPFQGGYLGVDIFFVISGFLITNLVARAILRGTFSFADFYWRRARRLLPPAYATIAACVLLAPLLLTNLEMGDFVKQVFGAVTLSANIVLWQQTGYFERAAELKPLLHMWSLSIEEQYYLILPAALVFAPRRLWLPGAVALTTFSLLVCIIALPFKPGAVFYLLPTRAWEMGFGSVLAIWSVDRAQPVAKLSTQNFMALLVIGWLWSSPFSRAHPGFDALLACTATAFLLAQPLSFLTNGFVARTLGWVGDRSYSLYLVHWPIFAFLNSANVGGGGVGWRYRLAGIAASLVLATLLFWAVEHRFRVKSGTPRNRSGVATLLACSVLLCISAVAVSYWSRSHSEFGHRLRGNVGLSAECAYGELFTVKAACRTAATARTLVWGDSYAMHLVPGLVASGDNAMVQATRATCAPVLGEALYAPPEQSEAWAKSCIAFNDSVLKSLSDELRSVDIVVLASQWDYLLGGRVVIDGANAQPADSAMLRARLADTIKAIRRVGKRVILVAPPPGPGFDAGRCNERLATGLWSFGGSTDCQFEFVSWAARSLNLRTFLVQVSRENDVGLITMDDVVCSAAENRCATRWGNTLLYRDAGHLSYEGSIAIAARMKLGSLIENLAR